MHIFKRQFMKNGKNNTELESNYFFCLILIVMLKLNLFLFTWNSICSYAIISLFDLRTDGLMRGLRVKTVMHKARFLSNFTIEVPLKSQFICWYLKIDTNYFIDARSISIWKMIVFKLLSQRFKTVGFHKVSAAHITLSDRLLQTCWVWGCQTEAVAWCL